MRTHRVQDAEIGPELRWFRGNVAAATLTALNGVVVGYGAVWFQLFGTEPNRDDYLVASGGYAAAAILIAAAVAGNISRRGAAWFNYAGSLTAVLLGIAALASWSQARAVEDRGAGISGAWDGVGGVIALPWSWAIVVLLILSVRHRLRTADTPWRSAPEQRIDRPRKGARADVLGRLLGVVEERSRWSGLTMERQGVSSPQRSEWSPAE